MKTMISIIEAIMYNLFPADLAAPVVIIVKDIIPLVGIAFIRIGIYVLSGLQKLQQGMSHSIQHNISWNGTNE